MRQVFWALLLSLVVAGPALAQKEKDETEAVDPPAAEKVDPAKLKEHYSYAIGLNVGRSIKADEIECDIEALVKGLTAGIKGDKPNLTDDQLRAAMIGLQKQLQARETARAEAAMEKAKEAGAKNKKEGDAYLAANKDKEGVKTTKSGLQYKVLKAGKGASPKATDVVKTHYHGTLINGKVFDSSVERGEPVSFKVNEVIPGWTEALQLMKVGDKFQLFIPGELAYGARGAGEDIGPNSVLIFEVELIEIEK